MSVLSFHPSSRCSTEVGDEYLVRLAQGGESAAFEELVRRHGRTVHKLALRFVEHPEDAEDIAQETWLSVHLHLRSFRFECSFRSWLWHIVRNQSLGYIRSAKRSAVDVARNCASDLSALVESLPSKSKSPEALSAESEMYSLALAAIQSLKPRHQKPLHLWVIEDRDITEIAAVTGTTYLAAKIALFRARRAAQARVRRITLLGRRSLNGDQTRRKNGSSLTRAQRDAA